jgi:hypothetical protein
VHLLERQRIKSAGLGTSATLRPSLPESGQAVADAPDVPDVDRVSVSVQLPSQAARVRVERAGAPRRVEAPDAPQKLLLLEDPFGILRERDEQLVVLRRELDRFAAHGDHAWKWEKLGNKPRCEPRGAWPFGTTGEIA